MDFVFPCLQFHAHFLAHKLWFNPKTDLALTAWQTVHHHSVHVWALFWFVLAQCVCVHTCIWHDMCVHIYVNARGHLQVSFLNSSCVFHLFIYLFIYLGRISYASEELGADMIKIRCIMGRDVYSRKKDFMPNLSIKTENHLLHVPYHPSSSSHLWSP